jgi:hypothetical protein
MTQSPRPPKAHGLYAAAFLVAAFFFCGTCNSCDAPASGDLPLTASAALP